MAKGLGVVESILRVIVFSAFAIVGLLAIALIVYIMWGAGIAAPLYLAYFVLMLLYGVASMSPVLAAVVGVLVVLFVVLVVSRFVRWCVDRVRFAASAPITEADTKVE